MGDNVSPFAVAKSSLDKKTCGFVRVYKALAKSSYLLQGLQLRQGAQILMPATIAGSNPRQDFICLDCQEKLRSDF